MLPKTPWNIRFGSGNCWRKFEDDAAATDNSASIMKAVPFDHDEVIADPRPAISGPCTPVKTALKVSEGRPSRLRAISDTDDFMARQQARPAQPLSPVARRWRRATEGGDPVLQTVIARRNLKHLQGGPEVTPAMWPHPPSARSQRAGSFRRHTLSGITIEEHRVADAGLGPHSGTNNTGRTVELEETVLALCNKLASANAAETHLLTVVNELKTRISALEESTEEQVSALRSENADLRMMVDNLNTDVERKSHLLEQVSVTFPAYVDALSLQHLGSLHEYLTQNQVSTLLEMLCLGADVHELHLLMLGESESRVNILPFMHLAGCMRRQFSDADTASNAITELSGDKIGCPQLTREAMAHFLQEGAADVLVEHGLDSSLVNGVSDALSSGIDPWSLVNLLDGRIMRSSTLDLRLAMPLAGALLVAKRSGRLTDADITTMLSKAASKCSLSPMRALRERNDELEAANIQLEAELTNMQHLLQLRPSKWKAEKLLGPKLPSDLWRVDSFGTSSGATSPSSPAPQPIAKVF